VRRLVLTLVALASLFALRAPAAWAHPLGNFTVSTAAHLTVTESEVVIEYAIDMAEIPTLQLQEQINRGDGHAAIDAIKGLYGPALRKGLVLEIDGRRVPVTLDDFRAGFTAGEAALDVLRIDASFSTDLASPYARLRFEDRNFRDRIGWREVTLDAASGQGISRSSAPRESISRGLRAYPSDLLSSPPRVTGATATLDPGAATTSGKVSAEVDSSPAESLFGGTFASLIERDLSPGLIVSGLLLAIGFGAVHALGPGHGKTVMAAYLVGAEGRARQAMIVGIAVSLMHTVAVVVLGLITLWASSVFAPESVYPWLSLVSGLVVVGLGTWLLRARLRVRRSSTAQGSYGHHYSHAHTPSPDPARAALHRPALAYAGVKSVGAVPQARRHHSHLHDDRSHDHAYRGDAPAAEHARAHALGLEHSHGDLPEGVRLLSWKALGAIAISGGLLPSPTAVVVLLGAVALHRVAFGIALVAAFSFGLAAALTIVGLVVLKARDALRRRERSRLSTALPVVSAGAILILGMILTTQAAISLPLWA
jgi:nickel/cobalt exporter